MLFGFYGVFREAGRTNPIHWFTWFLGVALFHDFVIAPVVFSVGICLKKGLPPRIRRAVQGGLIVSAVLALISIPALAGFGKHDLNATILPNNYPAGLAVVAVVAFGVAGVLAWRRPHKSDAAPGPEPAPGP